MVIGIDPGTMCGWAVVRGEQRLASGVWDLQPRRHEGGGMRYLRVRQYLGQLLEGMAVPVGGDVVVAYEEVRRHMSTDAAHVYGGIIATIASVCEEREVPYRAIPVGTIKRAATGKGNASKQEMIEAFFTATGWEPVGDDEADAYWCAVAQCREL